MVKLTPPMGWNSWNTFGENINEHLIFETADKLVSSGLSENEYNYLVIDDCWAQEYRDKSGKVVPDSKKFPNGIKAVADYVHSKGLKFGIYSCAGYPGSFEHELIDAQTFAEWGVDFLKYDYCYHSNIIDGQYLYRRMGIALENCGRDILFSACTWGIDHTYEWIKEISASMWRSTGDIMDQWGSVKDSAKKQNALHAYNGVGCFNDMDILTNKEMIRINQDVAGRQPVKLNGNNSHGDLLIYYKQLAGGNLAVGIFNLSDKAIRASFNLDELGLPVGTGKTLEMHEVWTKQDSIVSNATFFADIAPFDSAVYICKVVNLQ